MKHKDCVCALLLLSVLSDARAAIALDRTRVIYNAGEKAVTLSISNENRQLPYLAQAWLADEQGEKVTSPLIVLPPLQRVDPGEKSQIKIQQLAAVSVLPQDRETLFYFNLREIPPRSDQANTLQIALQTSIKLFWRPQAIVVADAAAAPWQLRLELLQSGTHYQVRNPTPYYVTLVDAQPGQGKPTVADFEPVMIAPYSEAPLGVTVSALGSEPVLTYVNDYGGRPVLHFHCTTGTCRVSEKTQ
ncbi:fimbria/pilus periplasmic chaperone [Erwinia sp. V71]|uniref:fimbria/pilus periplasmic chaperone n=1 Tax=Erwinia sp. V71 TaxID=3369424 RepID=UPI003F5EC4F7